MSNRAEKPPQSFDFAEGYLLIAGFLIVSALFLALIVILSKLDNEIIALPALSIAGIVLLLISLAAIAYVFVRTGLQDRKQALGLPAGSIQAVIALSLIVLFAILSVFIFTSMGPSSLRKITGLSAAERDAQMTALSNAFAGWEKEKAGADTYTIYVRDPGLDARNDVGKQLVVLIGTLMTSAVSFYFGTRAMAAGVEKGTEASAGASGSGPPDAGPAASIGSVTPETDVRVGSLTKVTIAGAGLKDATDVTFRQAGKADGIAFKGDISATDRSDTGLVCTVNPDTAGDYDCIVTVGGKSVTSEKALTVLAAGP